jgi:murein peptide amidase A
VLQWILFIVSVLLIAGCATQSVTTLTTNPTESPPRTEEPRVVHLGRSVNGAPITMELFGHGPRPIFIMGGIHGDEPTSVDVAKNLAELLREQPHLTRNVPVAILAVASPDGYAKKLRLNERGVDLNRNFPAKNFPFENPPPRNGPYPLSEPESQAILAAINTLEPRLLISIHSITRGRECNNYDGPAGKPAADLMSTHNGYPSVESIGYPTPGSLGSYAGIDRAIPMVTLELPRTDPAEKAWSDNREALLAVIRMEQSKPQMHADERR